jgi:hypothetical protein
MTLRFAEFFNFVNVVFFSENINYGSFMTFNRGIIGAIFYTFRINYGYNEVAQADSLNIRG